MIEFDNYIISISLYHQNISLIITKNNLDSYGFIIIQIYLLIKRNNLMCLLVRLNTMYYIIQYYRNLYKKNILKVFRNILLYRVLPVVIQQ